MPIILALTLFLNSTVFAQQRPKLNSVSRKWVAETQRLLLSGAENPAPEARVRFTRYLLEQASRQSSGSRHGVSADEIHSAAEQVTQKLIGLRQASPDPEQLRKLKAGLARDLIQTYLFVSNTRGNVVDRWAAEFFFFVSLLTAGVTGGMGLPLAVAFVPGENLRLSAVAFLSFVGGVGLALPVGFVGIFRNAITFREDREPAFFPFFLRHRIQDSVARDSLAQFWARVEKNAQEVEPSFPLWRDTRSRRKLRAYAQAVLAWAGVDFSLEPVALTCGRSLRASEGVGGSRW